MKNHKNAIYVLLLGCFSLTACGLKTKPKPEEGTVVTFPGKYPKPADWESEICHQASPLNKAEIESEYEGKLEGEVESGIAVQHPID